MIEPQIKMGYTNDGNVFMVITSNYEGKDVETIIQWEPVTASRIADGIRSASIEATKIYEGLKQ